MLFFLLYEDKTEQGKSHIPKAYFPNSNKIYAVQAADQK